VVEKVFKYLLALMLTNQQIIDEDFSSFMNWDKFILVNTKPNFL